MLCIHARRLAHTFAHPCTLGHEHTPDTLAVYFQQHCPISDSLLARRQARHLPASGTTPTR